MSLVVVGKPEDFGFGSGECHDDSLEEVDNNITLHNLCGNLVEEVFDDDSYHLSCDFQAVSKKNKAIALSYGKNKCKVNFVKKFEKGFRMKRIFFNSSLGDFIDLLETGKKDFLTDFTK